MIARKRGNGKRTSLVLKTHSSASWTGRLAMLLVTIAASAALAQNRPHHYFQRADMPPGSIGRAQLMRGGPLPGHFQAVEISAPHSVQLALAVDGLFEPTRPAPLKAGMLIGQVYRLKVTNVPFRPGLEVFPSIEIINRLYPPVGSEARFPIPIQLTREELEMALKGQYVVRVIYLENPRTALPRREDPNRQRYFEVGPAQDPLEVADALGRPMAILRLGSRVPEVDQASGRFLFQSPPWMRLPEFEVPVEVPARNGPAQEEPDAETPAAKETQASARTAVANRARRERGPTVPRTAADGRANQ